MRSIPVEIKHTFLHFLQAYFSSHSKWTWNDNVRKTRIVISDQYSTEKGIVAHRPSVILQRGAISWGKVFRNEMKLKQWNTHKNYDTTDRTSTRLKDKHYTDLLNTSVTFRVLTRTAFEADEIANTIFMALTAYKDDLKAVGIHEITGLSMSGEQQVQASSEQTFSATSVTCSFISQHTVGKEDRLYNARVYVDGAEVYERFAYEVGSNGTLITFLDPLDEDSKVIIDYIDAVTLIEKEDVELIRNSSTEYLVPNGGAIYGYYDMLMDFNIQSEYEEESNDFNI